MESRRIHRNWNELLSDKFIFAAKTYKPLREISTVATFGSCFANEVRNSLSELGVSTLPKLTLEFAKYVSERSFEIPSWGCYDERIHLQYYNPGSLAQELNRAVGLFCEADNEVWMSQSTDGVQLWADPYKRFLFANSHASLLRARAILNDQITHALQTADTVILTLGLTEAFRTEWKHFACLPPVIADRRAHRASTFHLLDFNTTYGLMRDALEAFLSTFPTKQILITTSPIPLDRTFRNTDIAVANCESKSILRTVCGQLERDFTNVIYFPSYELVVSDSTSWEQDGRHVSPTKVRQIMSNFIDSNPEIRQIHEGSRDPKYFEYASQWTLLHSKLSGYFTSLDPAACREQFNAVLEKLDRDELSSSNLSDTSADAYRFWKDGKPYELKDKTRESLVLIQSNFRKMKLDFFNSHTADAEVIIELGSGPGLNLFSLAMSNPNLRKFSLHAFEYTRAGRDLTNHLSVRLGISVHTHPVDFNEPNTLASKLQEISGDRPTVIFTSYSIEQIPIVKPVFLDAILSIKNLLRVLHVEPVGWQVDENNTKADDAFKLESIRLGYNENLIDLLFGFQQEGKIANLDLVKNATSHRFTLPGTFVRWEPKKKSLWELPNAS